MNRLEGKVAIITGASGGIGKATAMLFIEEGADVLMVDLNEDELSAACTDMNSNKVSYFVGDVTRSSDNFEAVKLATERYGGLDVFIANAGIGGDVASIEEYEESRFDKVMEINAKAPFLGLNAAIPAMTARGGGSFVITSSVAGVIGASLLSPYVMSKHAVVGLMKSASKECAPLNIRVNTVNPAPVETDMMRIIEDGMDSLSEEGNPKARIEESIPLGRYAQPEEIAKLMLFLSSDDSSFVTGSVYLADGGSTA